MPTSVNYVRLDEWKDRLPARLHTFLENFFSTCEPFDPDINFANYLNDIDLYGRTTPGYRKHRPALIQAFYEITGAGLSR